MQQGAANGSKGLAQGEGRQSSEYTRAETESGDTQ